MIRRDLAGARGGSGEGGADALGGAERSDTAADSPIHRYIADVIVIRIEASGMNGKLIAGGQAGGIHLIGFAAGAGKHFHPVRLPHGNTDGPGGIADGGRMAGHNQSGSRCFARTESNAGAASDHDRIQRAGAAPGHRLIAKIVALGVITGGVQDQDIVRGQIAIAQLRSVALRALNDFDISKIAQSDRDRAGGVIQQCAVIGGNLAGTGRGGGERCADSAGREQASDAAAHAPIHTDIIDVIVVGVETGGVHGNGVTGRQADGIHFGGVPGSPAHDFDMVRCSDRDGNGAGFIAGGGGMGRLNRAAGRRQGGTERHRDRCSAHRRRQIAGAGPGHRHIAQIIALGIITGRMDHQLLIGGKAARAQFRAITGRPFDDLHKRQAALIHGDGAGGVVNQRGVVGGDLAGARGRGRKRGGHALQRIQRADTAADIPIHGNVLNIIAIRIEAGGVHGDLIPGGHGDGAQFRCIAAGAGHHFYPVFRPGIDGNRTGGIAAG